MQNETKSGALNAIAAYSMWGIAPIYFKMVQQVPADEILIHRIIWSLLLLLLLLLVLGKWRDLTALLQQPSKVKVLLAAGLLLGVNWLIFIYAVTNDHILEASLGYYINPLFNVLVGFLVLGERFRRWQKVAIGLAFLGVLNQLIAVGTIPIVALSLAATFCIYGLLRKQVAVDSFTGLTVETALLAPLAIIYWLVFAASDHSNMLANSSTLNFWLIMAGVVTTAPLLCFNAAAKKLSFSALGLFQYIGPSLMFILAVFVYNESLDFSRVVTFCLIWIALVVFSVDSIRQNRYKKVACN